MRRITPIALAGLLALFAASPSRAGSITVLDPGSIVAGQTIGQWTESWWNWAGGMSASSFTDSTGGATVNQSGPVVFLAGTHGAATQTFSVASGEYVLLPLLTELVAGGFTSPYTSTQNEAFNIVSHTFDPTKLSVILDGVSVGSLWSHREASPNEFTLNLTNGNPLTGSTAIYTDAASDGYWLMLGPSDGTSHTLTFGPAPNGNVLPDLATPEPASLSLFGMGLAGMLGYGWRRRGQTAN
jgi:hypothetical protein